MFRQQLLGGVSRAAFAPENDEGYEDDDLVDDVDDVEDEPEDDEDDLELEVDEPDEDDEPEPVAARAPRKTFSQRVEEVAGRKANEATASLKAELELLKQQRSQPQGESQAQRNERLNQMEPWERTEYLLNERLSAQEFQTSERLDKMAFDGLCASDPIAARMKNEVEQRLAQMRAQGTTVARDVLFTFLVGEKARANKGRSEGKARKTAAANRDRQVSRPSSSRGDAAPSDRRGSNAAAARAKRLENQNI